MRRFLTPESLALLEERKGGLLSISLLVVEYLEHVSELNDYILRHFDLPSSNEKKLKKIRFIDSLAGEIRRLHESGVYQADLKSNNILVRETGDGWQFFFIDLDRVRFEESLSYRKRVKNLGQVNASVADCITIRDRLRFFKTYAAGTSLVAARKRIYGDVLNAGMRKVTEPYRIFFRKK